MRKKLVCVFNISFASNEEEIWQLFIESDKYNKDKEYITECNLYDESYVYEII